MKDRHTFDISIEELKLSVRCHNCLVAMGIETIGQLLEYSEREMLETKNFGRKSFMEVEWRLKEWRKSNEK